MISFFPDRFIQEEEFTANPFLWCLSSAKGILFPFQEPRNNNDWFLLLRLNSKLKPSLKNDQSTVYMYMTDKKGKKDEETASQGGYMYTDPRSMDDLTRHMFDDMMFYKNHISDKYYAKMCEYLLKQKRITQDQILVVIHYLYYLTDYANKPLPSIIDYSIERQIIQSVYLNYIITPPTKETIDTFGQVLIARYMLKETVGAMEDHDLMTVLQFDCSSLDKEHQFHFWWVQMTLYNLVSTTTFVPNRDSSLYLVL